MTYICLVSLLMLPAGCSDFDLKHIDDIGDGIKLLSSTEFQLHPEKTPQQIVDSLVDDFTNGIKSYLFDVGGSGAKVAVMDSSGIVHLLGMKLDTGYITMDLKHNIPLVIRNIRWLLNGVNGSIYHEGKPIIISNAGYVNGNIGFMHRQTDQWEPGDADGKVRWGAGEEGVLDYNLLFDGLMVTIGPLIVICDAVSHTLGLLHTLNHPTDFSALNLQAPILSLAIGSGVGARFVSPDGNRICTYSCFRKACLGNVVWPYHNVIGSKGFLEPALKSDRSGLEKYLDEFCHMLENIIFHAMHGHIGSIVISGGAVSPTLGHGLLRTMMIDRLRNLSFKSDCNITNIMLADFESAFIGGAVGEELIKAGIPLALRREGVHPEDCLVPHPPAPAPDLRLNGGLRDMSVEFNMARRLSGSQQRTQGEAHSESLRDASSACRAKMHPRANTPIATHNILVVWLIMIASIALCICAVRQFKKQCHVVRSASPPARIPALELASQSVLLN